MNNKPTLKKEDIPNLNYWELLEHVRLSPINSDEYVGLLDVLKEEVEKRDPTRDFTCMKCGHTEFTKKQFRASGGGISAIFDFQNQRYIGLVCNRCVHTEFYHADVNGFLLGIDLLIGG